MCSMKDPAKAAALYRLEQVVIIHPFLPYLPIQRNLSSIKCQTIGESKKLGLSSCHFLCSVQGIRKMFSIGLNTWQCRELSGLLEWAIDLLDLNYWLRAVQKIMAICPRPALSTKNVGFFSRKLSWKRGTTTKCRGALPTKCWVLFGRLNFFLFAPLLQRSGIEPGTLISSASRSV
jgi:hypothetical protein